MKHYVGASALALMLHLAMAFAVSPYQQLLLSLGGMVTHGNDIADIPRMMTVGAVLMAPAWITAALAFVFATRDR